MRTFTEHAGALGPAGGCSSSRGRVTSTTTPGTMPWPLTRAEIESFREHGLSEHSIADVLDEEKDRGLVRHWLAWFIRTEASQPAPWGPGKAVSHGR